MPVADRHTSAAWGRVVTVLGLAGGLALGAILVVHEGPARVLRLLSLAWWGLLAAIALHLVQIVLTGMAWSLVLPGRRRPVALFVAMRWLREGVNRLLPVPPIAGVIATLRVLSRHGVRPSEAAASTLVDSSVEVATQVPFTLTGLGLLAAARGAGTVNRWMLAGALLLCALAAVMLPARRLGVSRLAERAAARFHWLGGLRGLDAALRRIWAQPRRVGAAGACHMAAWLLSAVEVWVVLAALGHPVGAVPALVIESLGQAVRIGGLVVPGVLGVQEGGYILLCGLFGVPAAAGLALSLIGRLRDVALGIPSLAVWLRFERRGRNRAPARLPASGRHAGI